MKYQKLIFILIGMLYITTCTDNPVGVEFDEYSWETSPSENQNVDNFILNSAFTNAAALGFVDGLLVIRNGFIIGEEYYNGYNKNRPHNVKSVSKSFLSLITGAFFDRGFINNLDEKMLENFPEYIYSGIDERKYDITLRHLLSMRMGIAAEAENNYELYQRIHSSSNWIKTTIELPLIFDPGEKMGYNTFETHLLSAIITKKTGQSTLNFAKDNVFDKMKIIVHQWEQDPQGYYFGGNSMYFTPREMAVLGQLYLNLGSLNGIQIVSREWIELSLTRTSPQDSQEWGVLKEYNYGYLWWLGKINGYKLYMALGYGGQFVIVFPEINLIVVATANENVYPDVDQEKPILDLVSKYILTAVIN